MRIAIIGTRSRNLIKDRLLNVALNSTILSGGAVKLMHGAVIVDTGSDNVVDGPIFKQVMDCVFVNKRSLNPDDFRKFYCGSWTAGQIEEANARKKSEFLNRSKYNSKKKIKIYL